MIGKLNGGKSFGGCVRYVVQKQGAEVLYGEGIRLADTGKMIADFNMQRKINPNLEKAVGHISLNWSEKDQLDNDKMIEIAQQYLQQMKIAHTQFLVVRHYDAKHPHVHVIYNRVDNQGKTISDSNERKRNVKVCRELTKEHQLVIGKGKSRVNRERLTGADKVKYEIYDELKTAVEKARNWKELENILAAKGISMQFKHGGKEVIEGISFAKENCVFKGSAIDRSFSFGKLNIRLKQNLELAQGIRKDMGQANERKISEHTDLSQPPATNYLGILLEKAEYEEPESGQFKIKRKGSRLRYK